MSDELVIMFPDLRGEGSLGAFGRELQQRYAEDEGVRLVPIINGVNPEELKWISAGLHPKLTPAPVSGGPGLHHALIAGYQHVIASYPNAAIVKMDTNEHPVELVPALVERACACGGMAIGNLTFAPAAVAGSPDELFLAVCPTLYATATKGKLKVADVSALAEKMANRMASPIEA